MKKNRVQSFAAPIRTAFYGRPKHKSKHKFGELTGSKCSFFGPLIAARSLFVSGGRRGGGAFGQARDRKPEICRFYSKKVNCYVGSVKIFDFLARFFYYYY